MDETRYAMRVLPRRRELLIAMAAGLCTPFAAGAQPFPTKPVRLILPQPPGGAADRLARMLADRLAARWGQPIIVENKPGGGVVVGTLATVRAPADGYTMALLGSSLSINAVQRTDLPYKVDDLQPVLRMGYYTMALVAAPDFPASDMKGLIALARSKPRNYFSFGSNGIGTSAQVAGELLNRMADIEMQHVPYNGAARLYTDMIGGQIPLGFAVYGSAESFVKQGQLKVLGVTSAKRSALYPDIPAIAETLPGFDVLNWAGILAPMKVPPDVLQKISADLSEVLREKELAQLIAEMGIDLDPLEPQAFSEFIASEVKRFAAVTSQVSPRSN